MAAVIAEIKKLSLGSVIRQGYLPIEQGRRLAEKLKLDLKFQPAEARLRAKTNRYFLTFKGDGTLSREEQETGIEKAIFEEYWLLTGGKRIEKVRFAIPYEGLTAEIDLYRDRDLITAEVECPNIETARKIKPLGKDITEDRRYKNRNLAR
ncbi:MAG: adenylate cyclase [Candidatus Pacearchaeota archaeon]|nr:adenylate cyclase [Candidatus Pacearchaeota archaeon]